MHERAERIWIYIQIVDMKFKEFHTLLLCCLFNICVSAIQNISEKYHCLEKQFNFLRFFHNEFRTGVLN